MSSASFVRSDLRGFLLDSIATLAEYLKTAPEVLNDVELLVIKGILVGILLLHD